MPGFPRSVKSGTVSSSPLVRTDTESMLDLDLAKNLHFGKLLEHGPVKHFEHHGLLPLVKQAPGSVPGHVARA